MSVRLLAQNGVVTTTQSFTYTGQIETFTVPTGVTSLTIEARGARGNANIGTRGTGPGKGAVIRGTFSVTTNQQLRVLVGGGGRRGGGGGGGSFVVNAAQPLLIAGGGGGSGSVSTGFGDVVDSPTKHGQASNNGGNGAGTNDSGGQGATNGGGGAGGQANVANYRNAGGGGGLLGDGLPTDRGGKSFNNGGTGGGGSGSGQEGGFGGGGAGSASFTTTTFGAGGGGGGFSGGGGGSAIFDSNQPNRTGVGAGGGGGSYNIGTEQFSATGETLGNSASDGLVTITYMLPCPPLTITRQPASSSSVCAGSPVNTFVTVDGSPTAYQWYQGNILLSNQTSATLMLPSTQTTDSGSYSVVVSSSCASTTSTAFNLRVNPVPPTPTLLTQSGQSYPGGQSSVTVDVNSGNVNLVAGNCAGTINWTGPNNTAGTGTTIVVPTTQVGAFIYQASCTMGGCTSQPASATVTVQGRLTVLHRDVDNYADNNAIQPLLVLQNQGSTALPLSALTLHYYLTVEGSAALNNLSVNYAQVGGQNVRLRYVPLTPAQSGASGYVEVSFTPGAGNLVAGANSGPIQAYFAKSDYGSLFEPDDYSYNPVRDQLTATQRITAYYDGVLIAGIEPGSGAQVRSVRALTESRNGPDATQINTVLEVRNEGTVAINYSDLRARYYFTSDGNERLQVEVDEGNISQRLVALPQPVAGANYYLEISYNQAGQLAPGASTGAIRYRISKPDGGRFNQSNDYSYQEQPQDRAQNTRVVVLAGSQVVWGTPPSGAPARLAYQEAGAALSVKVLGNPIQNDQVSFEVTGADGQPLQVQLLTPQGRVVSQQLVPSGEATQRHRLSVVGQAGGLFLLQVSTPTHSQTVKVVKAQ